MKRDRKTKNINVDLYNYLDYKYDYHDPRYWGVFYCSAKRHDGHSIRIDPRRFYEKTGKGDLDAMNSWRVKHLCHYFYPAKKNARDYKYRLFANTMSSVRNKWTQYAERIEREIQAISKPQTVLPGDYGNFMMGISSYAAAEARANMLNALAIDLYKQSIESIIVDLYKAFIDAMASRIESTLYHVLYDEGKLKKKGEFTRNDLLTAYDGIVEKLPSYKAMDELYCVWNFLKHNSVSTHKKLKQRFPQDLADRFFHPGDLAVNFVQFNEDMVKRLIDGCENFFKEFCRTVFHERIEEYWWNNDKFFEDIMEQLIEQVDNPLRLGPWDDID